MKLPLLDREYEISFIKICLQLNMYYNKVVKISYIYHIHIHVWQTRSNILMGVKMRIIFKLFFLNNLITFNIQHISVNIIVNLVFTTLKITMSILLYTYYKIILYLTN